ncbi:hypothetical protein GGR54DRAFT_585411 [Hypoxylon sp. NC1633]|nr:hypothetical protein GGR54DRAFT_585411 [Hypoxylon sp. NC1633]
MAEPASTSARRCGTCRRQKQKCTFSTGNDDVCDRCAEQGWTCRPPPRGTPGVAPVRNLFKCDYCRKAHETCHPPDRKWPERCDYCVPRGLPCTVPRNKKEYDDRSARDATGLAFATQPENTAQPTKDASVPRPGPSAPSAPRPNLPRPNTCRPESHESDTSSPVAPPTKRQKADLEETKLGAAEKIEKLRSVVKNMEEEFNEVLRVEQEKHKKVIQELKEKHQEDLSIQKQKYVKEIDVLIEILSDRGNEA